MSIDVLIIQAPRLTRHKLSLIKTLRDSVYADAVNDNSVSDDVLRERLAMKADRARLLMATRYRSDYN